MQSRIDIKRVNFLCALNDHKIDRAELRVKILQFEQRHRRAQKLMALPAPPSQEELDVGCLLASVGL